VSIRISTIPDFDITVSDPRFTEPPGLAEQRGGYYPFYRISLGVFPKILEKSCKPEKFTESLRIGVMT
jgi:hypothetical protein